MVTRCSSSSFFPPLPPPLPRLVRCHFGMDWSLAYASACSCAVLASMTISSSHSSTSLKLFSFSSLCAARCSALSARSLHSRFLAFAAVASSCLRATLAMRPSSRVRSLFSFALAFSSVRISLRISFRVEVVPRKRFCAFDNALRDVSTLACFAFSALA